MPKSKSSKEAKPVTRQTVDDAREMMIRFGCPSLFAPVSPTAPALTKNDPVVFD